MRGISGMVVQIGPCRVAAIEMVELRRTWGGFGKLDDPGEGAMLVFVAMVERKLRKIKKAVSSCWGWEWSVYQEEQNGMRMKMWDSF
jgi:hypothetical protein